MTEAEKYSTLIEKIPQVNEAGKNSMLKYHPEATVIGEYISLNDVSELPHEVKCKISGADDPTKVKVTRCGKNILPYPYAETSITRGGITFTDNGDGSITAKGTATASSYFALSKTLDLGEKSVSSNATGVGYRIGEGMYYDASNGITSINITKGTVIDKTFYPIVVTGDVLLKYEPYNGQTLTPNADGTVEGMTSVSPIMNIFTDAEGANIEVTYRKSKGMEVEKEQFYNDFKQGIINDSISFEWMTGLGRTNTALIVNGLSDNATGQTLTLNLAGVNRDYETSSGANDGSTSAAFAELVATKPNWTITLI